MQPLDGSGFILQVTSVSAGSIVPGAEISGPGIGAGAQILNQWDGTPGGPGLYELSDLEGTVPLETMTESYGLLTVGSVTSGTVAVGEQVTGAGVASATAIEDNLSGSGAGSTWVVNNAQTVAPENMAMMAPSLSVLYISIVGATANRDYFDVQPNYYSGFDRNPSSLSYMGGTAAAALGLTQASGATELTPGGQQPSAAAYMNNLIQNENSQFGSFQGNYTQLAQEDPEYQGDLAAWAQSTDGLYQFLSYTGATPPAGSSTPTTDPAGTYSGPGASAPTPADPGTYIPVTGATSVAAEIVDPAGAYSGAGASAPITDPAGTYSSTGASAPSQDPAGTFSPAGASASVLAAAGTYIPGAGATSSAAELVDPAGSYSGAGTSAPTLAQPGYYVPTAGASSETPDDPGYYTPYAGMTAELLAQAPVILGTVAEQSTRAGRPDTPFASVTITDPNIDTSDSLSIQLTGAGGALADGVGFDGLTSSGPGVYLLSGTAAAITSELDALVFTPSAGSGTTTFTLTDTTSVGTSASDDTTTVTILSGGPPVVSVSTFLADQSTLDETQGGFDISDIAANITANLDQLNDPNIDAITISDDGRVGPSVLQLTSDATAIGKLENANSSPVLLAISDNAGNIEAGLSTLVAGIGEIASITASGGPVAVSTTTFLADQPALDKIVGGFAISDTAADVVEYLGALSADPNITSITASGGPVAVSTTTFLADQPTLEEIVGGFAISDAASNIAANLNQLSDPNIDAITISDNGQVQASVQQLTSDAAAIGKLENANSSTVLLAISDTAADLEAGLSTLVADIGEIASITAFGGPVAVSATTFLADQPTLEEIVGGFAISDAASNISANLDSLGDPEINSITISDNAPVGASVAQLTNDATAIGKLENASGGAYQLAITDTASNVLAALATLEGDVGHIASIIATGEPVIVSVSTFSGDQFALDRIVGGFDISDTAANVVAKLSALDADLHVAAITATSGSARLSGGVGGNASNFSETGSGTSLTVAEALGYAGAFSQGAGSTLNISSADTLSLTGTASLSGTTSGLGSWPWLGAAIRSTAARSSRSPTGRSPALARA